MTQTPEEAVQSAAYDAMGALAEENARLREALEPFGRLADTFDERLPDTELVREYYRDDEITVGDLRRARKALSAHPHASDCDKQGEALSNLLAGMTDANLHPEIPVSPVRPSDRTADALCPYCFGTGKVRT